jgi:DNA gyrase subunit A
MGRATQGVKLINIKADDQIASVAKVEGSNEEEIDENLIIDPNINGDTDTGADTSISTDTSNDIG